ncbi:MAG: substrate-binding domain-containing protein [Chloroflexi bacterium]|nr:substrate-binding domain-containing protein [Chloroflexota bacterium]
MSEKRISRRDFLRASLAAGTAATLSTMPAGLTYAQEQAFLNYWTGWSGFEFDVLQGLVDQFNEEHANVYVNMTTVFGQYEKVLTAIAGGNPPDVVSAVWLHQLVQIASQGALTPLTAYAEAAGIDGSKYFPQLWNNWWHNGELWGLMCTSNARVLAFSPPALAELGMSEPPSSIEELDEACQAFEIIDSNGNIERVGLLPDNLTWWAHVFGGSLYDEDSGTITANDPVNVAALEWMAGYWSRLGPERVAAFTSGFGDYLSTQNPFFVGKEGFKQVGEWFIQFQKQFAPDLEMDMIAAPYPDGGRPNCTTFGGSVFTIPTGVMNPDAAWEFIRWLSEDDHMGEFCFNIQNIPPKVGAATAERFVRDHRFQLALDLLNGPNAFGPPKIPVNDFYNSRLGEAETSVKAGMLSAQEALDRVTEEVQRELDMAMM